LFYPGLALFILGLALTMWAYRTLGRFFSLIVQVQTDHRVVDTGPYRFVRHPGYAGVLLGFLGLGLALQSWAALVVMAVATPAALAYRLRLEEQFLVTELGTSTSAMRGARSASSRTSGRGSDAPPAHQTPR
jgi:protein-S-isoprenylcysteine O-methyltransferase